MAQNQARQSVTDMTHRDEIHGDIRFDPLAVALLDTPALQRLGRIYQLGYGHLVYRGGTHTRLSHTMGAYYTALRLVTALRRNYEGQSRCPEGALLPSEFLPGASAAASSEQTPNQLSERWTVLRHLVGWAALLHDVAHVPVGHTLEDELGGIYPRHDDFRSPRLRHLWMGEEADISRVLSQVELYPREFKNLGVARPAVVRAAVLLICLWKERIADGQRTTFAELLQEHLDSSAEPGIAAELLAALGLASPSLFLPYMADLVANTISADYLDYLRRDPHNLGLDVLRDDRIVSYFWIGRDHRDQARMALSLVDRRGKPRLDTCTGVVDLVRQRYRFAEIVYYHKTKVSSSAMLAKVFRLLGEPPAEIPRVRTLPTIGGVEQRIAMIEEAKPEPRRKLVKQLKEDCTPSALLDPEIGDESLLMLLREEALEKLERSLKQSDRDEAVRERADRALRAIVLLDAIARRRLYKAVFTMDPKAFRQLIGAPPLEDTERRLGELIEGLRSHANVRDELERRMVSAAGWPDAALLLYVPGRKSQAKGIETGALAKGVVVTLGSHDVVTEPVEELGHKYSSLWRLILLVHPDYAGDVVGISAAVDTFLEDRIPDAELDEERVIGELRACCWFPYVAVQNREAACQYRALETTGRECGGHVDYAPFDKVRGVIRSSQEQLALSASLLSGLMRHGASEERALELHARFRAPDELEQRIHQLSNSTLPSAGRLGDRDADASVRAIQLALDQICDDLISGAEHGR
jgi:HD superfamily phosphohydrolase